MALIAELFQRSTAGAAGKHPTTTSTRARPAETVTSCEMSCPDETPSAIREPAIEEKANIVPQPKKAKKKPRTVQQGVPVREEFSLKSVGRDPSFLVRLTRCTIFAWCGATFARRIVPSRPKVLSKSCGTTDQRKILGAIKGGGTYAALTPSV